MSKALSELQIEANALQVYKGHLEEIAPLLSGDAYLENQRELKETDRLSKKISKKLKKGVDSKSLLP
jgi:hypothetical protein